MRQIQLSSETGTHYLELIRYQVYAHLRAETERAGLGLLWWILEPVLYMGTFYLVFRFGFRGGGEGFIPFLLTGLICWKLFQTTVTQGSVSISSYAGLMMQVYIPKFIFPTVIVLTNTIKFLVVLLLLLCFFLLYGVSVSPTWILLPILVLVQFLLVAAVSGLAAVVVPFLPELKLIIENVLLMMFFISGIFFDIAAMPQKIQFYLSFNPMVVIIDSYRQVLLHGRGPEWGGLFVVAAASLAGIWVAYRLLARYDRVYPRVAV